MSGSKPPAAPLPRDHNQASFSEMVPLRSTKIKLAKSPLLVFGLMTAVATVMMFALMGELAQGATAQARYSVFQTLTMVLTLYLLALMLLAVHVYTRTDKPIFYYVFPFAVVCALLRTPLGAPYFLLFRSILPGSRENLQSNVLIPHFIGHFFGAGMMEELMKATPTLIAAALTVFAVTLRSKLPAFLYNLIRVRSPLDAVLMGLGAGAGFIFIETWTEYVPSTVNRVFNATQGNDLGAMGLGLMLLLPRVLSGTTGHMAWAGIFAYFIGLAVIRPAKAPMLLGIGWITAAFIHACWNTAGLISPYANYVVAGFTAILLVACLLKARQLEATLFGRSAETFGSIVVGSPAAAAMAPAGGASFTPVSVGLARPVAPTVPAPVAPPTGAPAVAAPSPASVPAVWTTPGAAGALMLAFDTLKLPLRAGAVLDLAENPALNGRADGLRAEVTQHPTNPGVLGLRNRGTSAWYAKLRDNTVQAIEPQKNVRLAPGVEIDFGRGLTAQIVTS